MYDLHEITFQTSLAFLEYISPKVREEIYIGECFVHC